MPPADFWNLAGRVGRTHQNTGGLIGLARKDTTDPEVLTRFVNRNVNNLNSTLISMIHEALNTWGTLDLHLLASDVKWSAFVQYIAHTYRQAGHHQQFITEIEQVLRGTLGFKTLREDEPEVARALLASVRAYAERLNGNAGRLTLVDTTGFSWETVKSTLSALSESKITHEAWDPQALFSGNNKDLKAMMGILLKVPELRKNLEEVVTETRADGATLARIISRWVNGATIPDLAEEFFSKKPNGQKRPPHEAITKCCQHLYNKLAFTTSWGLSALQALTYREELDEQVPEPERQSVKNLPARVYYGVNSDDAIALRFLNVPRVAATRLSQFTSGFGHSIPEARNHLQQQGEALWTAALGEVGADHHRIWKILEGSGA